MSKLFDAGAAEQLAEALLLADPDDDASLDDLREALETCVADGHGEQSAQASKAIRECLELLGSEQESHHDNVIERVSALITPLLEVAGQSTTPSASAESDEPAKVAAEATPKAAKKAGGTSRRAKADKGAAGEESKPGRTSEGAAVDAAPETSPDTTSGSTAAAAPGAAAASAGPAASLADDPELVRDFIESSREHLDEADALLLTLESDAENEEAVNSVFRSFHTIKGMAGFLALQAIEDAAHTAEDQLAAVRKKTAALSRETVDSLFATVDQLRSMLDDVAERGSGDAAAAPSAMDPPAADASAGAAPPQPDATETATATALAAEDATGDASSLAAADPTETRSAPSPGDAQGQPESKAVVAARRTARARSTVQVDEARLDLLLETIGELVIAEASAGQALKTIPNAVEIMATEIGRLDKISRQLQEMATSMRMVTFRTTLRRMARLVRDLSRETDKEVRCQVDGEEVELDKHVVEGISDALIHLVRNAVDHGIEADPVERAAAGKPAAATISITAAHTGGHIVIEVADDGRGIDRDALLKKAREVGLVAADETPPPEAVLQLIFAPGISTARTVSGVSGRGVGMDVVKRTVEGMLGSVAISSRRGVGTRVSLTVPLTLAIIDGMLVRVGGERYVIPTLSIVRSLRLSDQDVTEVLGRAEMLATSQGLVPLLRLAQLFACARDEKDEAHEDDIVTIVSEADGSELTGLVVSELLGQQQIIMKPLGNGLGEVPGISGAAILPDGTVGLVIDIHQTVRLAHEREGAT